MLALPRTQRMYRAILVDRLHNRVAGRFLAVPALRPWLERNKVADTCFFLGVDQADGQAPEEAARRVALCLDV